MDRFLGVLTVQPAALFESQTIGKVTTVLWQFVKQNKILEKLTHLNSTTQGE